jgi:PPOX class probable F420-dependent enzyme
MLKRDRDYLLSRRRGFLATSAEDRPTVIPVCFCLRGDVIYTAIDRKPKGPSLARLSNIATNPRAAFIVDNYSEDWRELSYLLIHGDVRLVKKESEAEAARKLLRQRYPQYRWLKLGRCPVLAIRVRKSKFWAFGGNPKRLVFS